MTGTVSANTSEPPRRGRPKTVKAEPVDIFNRPALASNVTVKYSSTDTKVMRTQAHFLAYGTAMFRLVDPIDINPEMPKSYAYETFLEGLNVKPIVAKDPVYPLLSPSGPILRPFTRDCITVTFSRTLENPQIVVFEVLPGEPPEGEPWFVLGKPDIANCLGADWTPEKMREQHQQQQHQPQQQQTSQLLLQAQQQRDQIFSGQGPQ